MTKPTGRPRGRPKTKEYATLMARIPQELVDQVKHYAGLHRQSISLVIREGLLLLLEHDPYADFMSDKKRARAETDITYDTKAAMREPIPEIMSDRKPGAPEQSATTQARGLSEKVSGRKAAAHEIVSDKNRDAPETTSQLHSTPAFDATKYILGKLCPRRHNYEGTGKSLLRLTNRHCLACDREKFHERKQAKRQTQRV